MMNLIDCQKDVCFEGVINLVCYFIKYGLILVNYP